VLSDIHLNMLNNSMIVRIFEHVQWRWARNARLAPRLGNTALLACCDVIIATANSTIAMGGPAMIEVGLYLIVTSQCSSTTLHQVFYHI
jgi:hypothetical protein